MTLEKKRPWRRFWRPLLVNLAVMILAVLAYDNFWRLGLARFNWVAGWVFGVVIVLSLGLGGMAAYMASYSRGGSPSERITAAMATPLAWVVWQAAWATRFFTPGEAIYYGLFSQQLLVLIWNLGLMGLGEMLARKRWGGDFVKVFTPMPILAVLLALAAVYVMFLWGLGVHWFYLYQEAYKALLA